MTLRSAALSAGTPRRSVWKGIGTKGNCSLPLRWTLRMRRVLYGLVLAAALLLVAVAAAVVWGRAQLRGSLRAARGAHRLPGLSADVQVTRDALGIPTIRAVSRADVARATGFLHAQDRFFQMDLTAAPGRRRACRTRRSASARRRPRNPHPSISRGGAARRRPERRRPRGARRVCRGCQRRPAAFASPPFEYLLLRQTPAPWSPEDSLLVVLSMFVTLQDDDGSYEATLATMQDVLPPAMYDFLAPRGSEWDAPVVGEPSASRRSRGPRSMTCGAGRQLPTPNSQLPIGPDELGNRKLAGNWELVGVGIWELGAADPSAKPQPSAATTSRCRAGSPPTAARSSPTTCT